MTTPISAAAAAAVAAEAGSPNIKAKKKPSNWSIILKAFRELGLPSCSAPADTWPDFDHLQGLLREAKVIVVTTKVLNTALKITDENSRFRAKKLLMSYVILMCPEAALGDINKPEEKRVYESAKEMLRLFEVWLKAHGHPGATAARLAFVNAYNEYISVFDLWKSKDYSEFVQIMIKDYVQESTLRQTMLASEEQMATIETLDENLKTRKKQIERFAGKEGLEQLQRALEAALSSTSTGRKKQKELNTPRSPDFEQEYFTNQQQQEYHHATGREYMSLLLDQYISSAENVVRDGLANAQLAHELIMDPDFKIEKLTSAFENKVKTIAQKAFFDKMAEDIQNGQAHAVIPPLFSDIKNRLLVLSNPESSLYNNIQESIDILLIEQQLKQHPEQFDIQSVIDHILGLMAWMCAPVRDDEINEARSLRTLTSPHNNDKKGRITLLLKQLQTILSLLEKMTLDHANYKLHLLRPHLLSIAVDYERESFAAWLEQQHSSTSSSSSSASSSSSSLTPLGRTETWLTKSVDKLCQEAAKRNPDNIERSNKPSHDAILEDAFLSLLCQPILIAKDNVPETLALDVSRLAYFQNEIQAITIGGALVIIAKSFGSNIDDNSMFELASRLFTMLENNSSIEHLSAELIRVAHVKSEQRELLKNVVDKTLNYKDKVFTLVLDRVVKIIKSTIQSRKFVTSATLESFGLQYVQSQLQATALNIQRLVNHNRKVYATWYNQLIVKAVNDKLGTHEPQQQ
ncbi:T-complex protein 11-domain-containing protein [Mycotypha africana]|uniref:T-complex protein 11-domain-containing protein n=1 Tax=Mycotypha africana TaxID=64632 RepID=UPI002301C08C|nr:T-complex protein 11-domain-containing protein [Mycotypha africana]KAI8991876.1 T-complex protein 11-domain-containing protein [Mycotypha africana]